MSSRLPVKFRLGINPDTMEAEGDVETTGDWEVAGGGMAYFKVEKGGKKASFKTGGKAKKAAKKPSAKKAKAPPPKTDAQKQAERLARLAYFG